MVTSGQAGESAGIMTIVAQSIAARPVRRSPVGPPSAAVRSVRPATTDVRLPPVRLCQAAAVQSRGVPGRTR